METLTNNQEVALEELELNATPDLDGKLRITTSTGSVLNESDLGTIKDTYYPKLLTKLVQQQVLDSYKNTKTLNEVFSKEEWTNGIKSFVYAGILDTNSFSREIAIEDLNADDPTMYEYLVSIDKREYTKLVVSVKDLITAFTTPTTLVNFITMLQKQLKRTFDYNFQNERAAILIQDTSAIIKFDYDKEIDTTDLSTEDIMRSETEMIKSYATASNEHTLIGVDDETIIYSASPSDLVLVHNKDFEVSKSYDIAAKLYHPEEILKDCTEISIDFSKIKGIDKDAAANVKSILIDKRTLLHGFQIENFAWNVNLPKLQILAELHNWYGYARLKNFPIVIFRDKVSTLKTKKKSTK